MKKSKVKRAFRYCAFRIEEDGTVEDVYPFHDTKATRYILLHPEVLNKVAKKLMKD